MGVQKSEFWIQRHLKPCSHRENSMGTFYSSHFPEGMHKLKPSDIRQAEDYFKRAFSDDISVTVFLPMIEDEETNHTFEHPLDWIQLNT